MKLFYNILQEIRNEGRKQSTKAQERLEEAFTAWTAYKDANGLSIFKGETFKTSAEYVAYKAAQEEYKKEQEKNTLHQIKAELLKGNAKAALFAETIKKIVAIWNKYSGKKYGEKTRQAIRDEMSVAVGCFVWVNHNFGGEFEIIPKGGEGCEGGCFPLNEYKITTGRRGSGFVPFVGEDNKINILTAEEFCVFFENVEYIQDIDGHAKKLLKAHKAALEAQAALKLACEEYNELTRGKIKRANPREGVSTWLF